ncbi:carbohydrate-binding protein [Robertkochia sp. 1368]|nr:carbohydrate-binding protein [Robertkochia sediminum]
MGVTWGQNLKAQGKVIVNAQGDEVLLRGVGPGGWQIMEGYMMQTSGVAGSQHEIREKLIDLMGEAKTETFFEKWRANHFTQRDVDSLAAWGFNSIRIPMHYNLFTLPIEEEPVPGENTWIETGFELIDNVLAWAAPHDMYIILDMHATPGGQGRGSEINDYDPSKPSLWESQENRDKLVALWGRIAERYKDHPWIGGYDLINETHWELPGNTALREIYGRITDAIRAVDTEHIIFIEGNSYANDHSGLTPPWDDNLVYSFHKYWNTNKPGDLDWILPLREQYNVPLWMGESGENSNTWFTDAVTLFENNNIGWAWWTMRKIGDIDSPYAVDVNPGYQKVIDYWKGEGPRPTEDETYAAMMQLAENLLVDNSRYRRDVPDALIRQVATDDTKPFEGTPASIPGIIYAANFDLGKNGYAYFDTDVADYNLSTGQFEAWNKGWSYRNDGVDIEKNEDNVNSNGFHVGYVDKGEWLKYTVNIAATGVYRATVRVATQESGGAFFLSLDGQEITANQKVTTTGGWTSFVDIEIQGIQLEEGVHDLKLHFANNTPVNLSSIYFEASGNTGAIPVKILNGQTGDDHRSIALTMNESLLPASLEGSAEHFQVMVNDNEVVVNTVIPVEGNDRRFALILDDYVLSGDKVTVSYSGTMITSDSGDPLEVFEDLEINDLLKEIFVLPGKLEMEDYDYIEGMGTEESTDEGEGRNLNYTDAGDFADYTIFAPGAGNYGLQFRFAGFDQGRVGLYLVGDLGEETELVVVNTPVTNGWQTWETVTATMFLEKGIHKMRMRVLAGGFNFNWIAFGPPDSDGDGVLDEVDRCPDTPENAAVDVHGCEVFSLPANNYALSVFSETCRAENNGGIQISTQLEYPYTATLSGEGEQHRMTFTTEAEFSGLSAGTYRMCITIEGNADYEQCFTVVVAEPDDLGVTTGAKAQEPNKIVVALKGAKTYYVTLNEQTITTGRSELTLDLSPGVNTLEVRTDVVCQGTYKETLIYAEKPMVFPNPVTSDAIQVYSALFLKSTATTALYNITGKLLRSEKHVPGSDQLRIDMSGLPQGVYLLNVGLEDEMFNYKIIKK